MVKKSLFAMVVLGFLFGVMMGPGSVRAAEPIRIGFMAPYVGVWTHYGNQMKNGFKLYLDEAGNKVAGREIVVINEDDEGKPDVGLVKARKLVEKDKVHLLTGIISSAVAYAVVDYVVAAKTPLVIANAGATKLTQEQRNPYVFRTSFANGQQDIVGGWWVAAKENVKKVVVIGPDYAAGHEKGNGFMKGFKLTGGEVVDQIWVPLDTADYAPYMAKLAPYAGKVDRLWSTFSAADAIRFINQYAEYGLKDKIKIFCENGLVDESSLPS
jgi:branched-chain amino acid transport system substrate-binding protein